MTAACEVQALSRNVTTIRVPLTKRADWEQWFLLTGDRHWDNPHSLRELQERHLAEARERGALVIDVGDFFCCMQGKWDKRADKSALRPEHQHGEYLDCLVDTASEWIAPWADLFAVIASGNHEEAIRVRHETSLIDRLVDQVRHRTGHAILHGGFAGWVRFMFKSETDGFSVSKTLHYDHGYGGGGPVTKGTIQTNRRAVYLPDADIVVSGHIHEHTVVEITRARLSKLHRPYLDTQVHVTVPTYKEEYGDGFGGWHCRRGAPPKPIGACWLRFFYRNDSGVLFDVTRAK